MPIPHRTGCAARRARWAVPLMLLVLAPGAPAAALPSPPVHPAPAVQPAATTQAAPTTPSAQAPAWEWPVDGIRHVVEPFRAPAHDYGPGHRGIDIAANAGSTVQAPADGVVAFRGVVVDRPLLTIDHGGGVVSTFEPLESTLSPGMALHVGDELGTVAAGGHTQAGALHLGVRVNGVYVNPLLMFGDVPRAVLLPCCDAVTRADAPAGTSP